VEENQNPFLKMKRKHPVGAVNLETLIEEEIGIHIPHNRIHGILKKKG
jgi:uncharacterized metal-binding protein YceD (DUF177 family)